MRSRVSRRYLAVWFPQLPLDRWIRREDPRLDGPFAVTARQANADRILCANAAALQCGVRMGQSFADASAVCPDLLTEPCDPVSETRLLSALHKWADRFSPRVALQSPDRLMMDVSGMMAVFGSEAALAEQLHNDLSDLRMVARIGIANTKMAASGFARFGAAPIHITEPDKEMCAVANLPIAALDLDIVVTQDFRRLGVKTIGDLAPFKSSELARRFSVRVPEALDALRGHRHDPLVPSATPPIFSASQTLPEPVGRIEGITAILAQLAERICSQLTEAGRAARGFRLTVRCVDTGDHDLEIGFSTPMRDVRPILRQFQKPLEGLKIEFGADGFRLLALSVELFRPIQADLQDTASQSEAALQQTVTTLLNRLGADRIRRPVALPGHTPETEHGSLEAVEAQGLDLLPHTPTDLMRYPRPELMWAPDYIGVGKPGHPPKRFTYKGQIYDLLRARGPERISPVWWREPTTRLSAHTRDFWRATTIEGRCFWIMSCADAPDLGWFCCGEFLVEPHFSFAASRR